MIMTISTYDEHAIKSRRRGGLREFKEQRFRATHLHEPDVRLVPLHPFQDAAASHEYRNRQNTRRFPTRLQNAGS
jgi:hypothetical protein